MTTIKPAAAIFILAVMVMSVAGFALMSASYQRSTPSLEIPDTVTERLSDQDVAMFLRSGRVIFENLYPENCTGCLDDNVVIESFASGLKGYLILEKVQVPANESRVLQMIGMQGRIVEMGDEINQESLMDTFCEIAMLVPRSCLIREV